MSRKNFYVSPTGTTNWKLTYLGKNLYENATKSLVVHVGRQTARDNQPSELIVQKGDGTIEFRETYGNDPFPPRG